MALAGLLIFCHCSSPRSHDVNQSNNEPTAITGANPASQAGAPRLQAQAGGGTLNGASMTLDTRYKIGGAGVVELRRATPHGDVPEFTYAAILPGRGMNTFQLQAYLPGRGLVEVLHSIPLESAEQLFAADDPHGNLSFKYGGAILVPFANRIRGKLQPDGAQIVTTLAGRAQKMIANWKGAKPGAEKHAMHGLILNQPVEIANSTADRGNSVVNGTLDAGDFSGHWPSKMRVHFHISLEKNAFILEVETKNTGDQPAPVGIGWHPYFAIPSGQRAQALLVIPARERALVTNYDDVFPTGKIEKVHGTKYDFSNLQGTALGDLFLDDCFFELNRDQNLPRVAEIIDPAANYGLRIHSLSPQIKAFQVYAPVDQSFIAFEPQFNLGDPYSAVWNASHGAGNKGDHVDTGMVTLRPGESVVYKVRLGLFTPGK